jgi:hypothetical protein
MSHHSRSHARFPALHFAGCLAASVLAVAGWLLPVQALPHRISGSSIYNNSVRYPVRYRVPTHSRPDFRHDSFGYHKPNYSRPGVRIIVNPISDFNPYPYGSSIIYGSPIPSPIPLHPVTRLPVYSHPSEYYSPHYRVYYAPGYRVRSDKHWRGTKNSIQVHPRVIRVLHR